MLRVRVWWRWRFDFIECFTTTFLRAHSWLNRVVVEVEEEVEEVYDDLSVEGAGGGERYPSCRM